MTNIIILIILISSSALAFDQLQVTRTFLNANSCARCWRILQYTFISTNLPSFPPQGNNFFYNFVDAQLAQIAGSVNIVGFCDNFPPTYVYGPLAWSFDNVNGFRIYSSSPSGSFFFEGGHTANGFCVLLGIHGPMNPTSFNTTWRRNREWTLSASWQNSGVSSSTNAMVWLPYNRTTCLTCD